LSAALRVDPAAIATSIAMELALTRFGSIKRRKELLYYIQRKSHG
jgi:hypothetical protein